MRNTFHLLLILILAALPIAGAAAAQDVSANPDSGAAAAAADLTVMSFNIRYDNPGDGEDAWPHRADGVSALIERHGADVVGLQEALPGQLDDLERLLPGFAWLGMSRGGEGTEEELSAILYRTSAVQPIDDGTFWLSETPDEAASRGWDAALPRIATWARFRLTGAADNPAAGTAAGARDGGARDAGARNGAARSAEPVEFLHLNTHFDHRGDTARVESARLIRRWLTEHAGDLPVVITGDFNATPGSDPIAAMTESGDGIPLQDAINASVSPHEGPHSTWNGFDAVVADRRIDFVFISSGVQVLRHGILDERLGSGRFPSDHLPVLVEISFLPGRTR